MRAFWRWMAASSALSFSYCAAFGLFGPGFAPGTRVIVIALGGAGVVAQLLLLLYAWRREGKKGMRGRDLPMPALGAALSVYGCAASLLFFVTRHWPFGAMVALTVVACLLPLAAALLSLYGKGRTGK